MGIGAGILLIAVGAILSFATDWSISGLDLDVVGVVLMIAGVVGIALFLIVWAPRRRAMAARPVERVFERPVERVVEERHHPGGQPPRRYPG